MYVGTGGRNSVYGFWQVLSMRGRIIHVLLIYVSPFFPLSFSFFHYVALHLYPISIGLHSELNYPPMRAQQVGVFLSMIPVIDFAKLDHTRQRRCCPHLVFCVFAVQSKVCLYQSQSLILTFQLGRRSLPWTARYYRRRCVRSASSPSPCLSGRR